MNRAATHHVLTRSGTPSPAQMSWSHRDVQDSGGSYTRVPILDPDEPEPAPQTLWEKFLVVGLAVLESTRFQVAMALLILVNALVIGLETDMPDLPFWDVVENAFLVIFTTELTFRLTILGRREFFDTTSDDIGWNVFDFIVVSMGVFDVFCSAVIGSSSGGAATLFRIIRLMRILRIFRIVRFLKQLYMLAFGLAEAAKAVFWVTILMSFVLYVCAIVLARTIGSVGEDDPNHDFLCTRFATIPRGMLTLFELMASPNLPEYQAQHDLLFTRPAMTFFFVVFVIFGSFGMIALLTGVISESMFEKNQLKIEEDRKEKEATTALINEICETMYARMPHGADTEVSIEDIMETVPKIERLFEEVGIDFTHDDLNALVRCMDTDQNGRISKDEFIRGVVSFAKGLRASTLQEILFQLKLTVLRTTQIAEAINGMVESQEEQTTSDGNKRKELEDKMHEWLQVAKWTELETQMKEILRKQSDLHTMQSSVLGRIEDITWLKEDMKKMHLEMLNLLQAKEIRSLSVSTVSTQSTGIPQPTNRDEKASPESHGHTSGTEETITSSEAAEFVDGDKTSKLMNMLQVTSRFSYAIASLESLGRQVRELAGQERGVPCNPSTLLKGTASGTASVQYLQALQFAGPDIAQQAVAGCMQDGCNILQVEELCRRLSTAAALGITPLASALVNEVQTLMSAFCTDMQALLLQHHAVKENSGGEASCGAVSKSDHTATSQGQNFGAGAQVPS